MLYYPINLNLQGRKIVVIGGGSVALRKVKGLLEGGGKVRLIDPKPLRAIVQLAHAGRISLTRRRYRRGDLSGAFVVVAATDDEAVNRQVHEEAGQKKILLNVVDRPELCSFIFPARLRRGDLLITVSTGGASPALAKKVRQDLERMVGPEYALLVKLMARLRHRFPPRLHRGMGMGMGRRFTALVRSPILGYLKKRDRKRINRLLRSIFGDKGNLSSL